MDKETVGRNRQSRESCRVRESSRGLMALRQILLSTRVRKIGHQGTCGGGAYNRTCIKVQRFHFCLQSESLIETLLWTRNKKWTSTSIGNHNSFFKLQKRIAKKTNGRTSRHDAGKGNKRTHLRRPVIDFKKSEKSDGPRRNMRGISSRVKKYLQPFLIHSMSFYAQYQPLYQISPESEEKHIS